MLSLLKMSDASYLRRVEGAVAVVAYVLLVWAPLVSGVLKHVYIVLHLMMTEKRTAANQMVNRMDSLCC